MRDDGKGRNLSLNGDRAKRPTASQRPRPQAPQNNVRGGGKNNARVNGIEAVPKQEKKEPARQRMSTRLKLILAFSAIALILIVSAAVNISIGVREVEIKGLELCTRDEILSVAGIEEGSGYFSYNTSKSEQRIKEAYPCVVDVRISRSMFGRVTVSVTEEAALWYIESYGEYFALSGELRVIKSSEERNWFIECGLVRLDFPEIRSAVLGKTVEIKDGDRDTSYVSELLSDVAETGLYKSGRLDQIKIKNKFDVYVVVDMRHLVSIGNCTDVEYKLGQVADVLGDNRFDWTKKSEILVSDPTSPTVRENSELDFSYLQPTK